MRLRTEECFEEEASSSTERRRSNTAGESGGFDFNMTWEGVRWAGAASDLSFRPTRSVTGAPRLKTLPSRAFNRTGAHVQ
jgi:hypothetical protein